jgi:hypothetical protein
MNALLTSSGVCPVCGHSTTLNQRASNSFNDLDGRQYLDSMFGIERFELENLLDEMMAYSCSKCGANYLEPWLSLEARNKIFILGHGVHNVGWRNFQERIEQNLSPSLVDSRELISRIYNVVPHFSSYVEFGCPFQGLLLHLASNDEISQFTRSYRTFTSANKASYRRFLPPLRVYMSLGRYAKSVALFFTGMRRFRNRVRGRRGQAQEFQLRNPVKKYFVPLKSTKFWGENCSMYGDSCTATAIGFMNIEGMSLQQFSLIENESLFDVVGLFNVLDHQDDPLALLRMCLQRARVTIVMSHNQPFGKQHQFGLGERFFENLGDLIGSCEVTKLHESGESNLLYLIKSPH